MPRGPSTASAPPVGRPRPAVSAPGPPAGAGGSTPRTRWSRLIERVLRRWPLSGVLAGLDEGPTAPLDLGGHEGLMLLYAERLSRRDAPAWRPSGRPLEYVELVEAAGEGSVEVEGSSVSVTVSATSTDGTVAALRARSSTCSSGGSSAATRSST